MLADQYDLYEMTRSTLYLPTRARVSCPHQRRRRSRHVPFVWLAGNKRGMFGSLETNVERLPRLVRCHTARDPSHPSLSTGKSDTWPGRHPGWRTSYRWGSLSWTPLDHDGGNPRRRRRGPAPQSDHGTPRPGHEKVQAIMVRKAARGTEGSDSDLHSRFELMYAKPTACKPRAYTARGSAGDKGGLVPGPCTATRPKRP
jgi:hypothetical protein